MHASLSWYSTVLNRKNKWGVSRQSLTADKMDTITVSQTQFEKSPPQCSKWRQGQYQSSNSFRTERREEKEIDFSVPQQQPVQLVDSQGVLHILKAQVQIWVLQLQVTVNTEHFIVLLFYHSWTSDLCGLLWLELPYVNSAFLHKTREQSR